MTDTIQQKADTVVSNPPALEVFDALGRIRDLASFTDDEVARLTPQQKELAHTLVDAQALVSDLEAQCKQAADMLVELRKSRADFSTKYAKQWARSFMDEWRDTLQRRHAT